MNRRVIFIFSIIAVVVSGIGLYKKLSSITTDEKKICIFSANIPGIKNDSYLIRQSLQTYDIKRNQIVENSSQYCENASIKIFFEQEKFNEYIKKDNSSLKIGIHLHDSLDEEDSKIVCLFEGNNIQQLLELIENIVKKPLFCFMIYDGDDDDSKRLVAQYQELAKIKGMNLQLCPFLKTKNRNISTILKTNLNEAHAGINAVILIPSSLIFSDFELILEHFKIRKIPVFANHAGLIRSGALGGYDFDMQEIAHDIAEVSNGFLRDSKTIKGNAFEGLYPQLHLNMDTIRHLGIQLEVGDLLDEAITVGGADL